MLVLAPVGHVSAATVDAVHVSTVVGHAEVMDFNTPVSGIAVGDPRQVSKARDPGRGEPHQRTTDTDGVFVEA